MRNHASNPDPRAPLKLISRVRFVHHQFGSCGTEWPASKCGEHGTRREFQKDWQTLRESCFKM